MKFFISTTILRKPVVLVTAGGLLAWGAVASAELTVTPTTNAVVLADALLAADGTGVTNVTVALTTHSTNTAVSSGTYHLTSPIPSTYGLTTDGIVLSTGNAADYSTGPNSTNANNTSYGAAASSTANTLLGPISGSVSNYDVTTLTLTFDVQPGVTNLHVSFVFGSEEFPEGILAEKDGFGIYWNGVNIALVNGFRVTSRHATMNAVAGTELDGVLAPHANPVITLQFPVVAGSTNNTLTFLIGDSNDDVTDSTVYLTSLGATQVATNGPDLSGTWLPVTTKCKTKKGITTCKVKARLQIANAGTTPSPTARVHYFLSNDNVLDDADQFLKQVATGKIKPGKLKKKTLSASRLGIVTGQYLIAVIDAENAVAESNENNNVVVFGPIP